MFLQWFVGKYAIFALVGLLIFLGKFVAHAQMDKQGGKKLTFKAKINL